MDIHPLLLGLLGFVGTVVFLLIIIGAITTSSRQARVLRLLDEKLTEEHQAKALKRDTSSADLEQFIAFHYGHDPTKGIKPSIGASRETDPASRIDTSVVHRLCDS
jgi:hypothetical protein